jgi:predicted nuclease with RNAse H fold
MKTKVRARDLTLMRRRKKTATLIPQAITPLVKLAARGFDLARRGKINALQGVIKTKVRARDLTLMMRRRRKKTATLIPQAITPLVKLAARGFDLARRGKINALQSVTKTIVRARDLTLMMRRRRRMRRIAMLIPQAMTTLVKLAARGFDLA